MLRPALALATLAGLLASDAQAQILVARYVAAENKAFEEPTSAGGPWKDAEPVTVTLLPQNITAPSRAKVSAENVAVRMVHNGTWLAVSLTWADETRNETSGLSEFPDAVAIGFPQGDWTKTSPFMGGGQGLVMEILHWKALWQRDVEEGVRPSEAQGGALSDEYTGFRSEPLPDSDPASSAPLENVLATPEARQSLPAVAIGNPMSQLARSSPVEQAIAIGFGSLSTQAQQDARGHGTHADGQWTVVVTRPLQTGDEADIRFTPGMETVMNVAVWDGAEGDRGGRKSYSMFTPLRFEPSP